MVAGGPRTKNRGGQEGATGVPTIAAKTEGMAKHPGFLTFYWDSGEGAIWLEIADWDAEFLYYVSLPAGVGSNDIGLDRSLLTPARVVRFDAQRQKSAAGGVQLRLSRQQR